MTSLQLTSVVHPDSKPKSQRIRNVEEFTKGIGGKTVRNCKELYSDGKDHHSLPLLSNFLTLRRVLRQGRTNRLRTRM